MKENIDLTANQDFNKPAQRKPWFLQEKTLSILSSRLSKTIPWDQNDIFSILGSAPRNSLVPIGNKEAIKKEKRWAKFEQGLSCECCGKDLSLMPWNMTYSLCTPCDEKLDIGRNGRTAILNL
ncbi:hypothetical protein COK00_11975 [Bacillus cereus]|nr:hypothetical protein COK00_11975 [Bacillus cereus]